MASSGPKKEMRIPTSFSFNPLIPESSETLDPARFHGAGDTIEPISVGSKLKSPPARYRECLKNHAANKGGNVTDGCGEFMPSGNDGTIEALKCAACNCHRNFHRKDDADSTRMTVHPLHLPPLLPSPSFNQHRTIPLGVHTSHWSSMVPPPVKVAFGGGSTAATDSSSDELNCNAAAAAAAATSPFGLSKKRFRTKFTQEQKEKMVEFAEKVGWRIPREDDAEVQRFCGEVGVKRQVLKVWMHNNKSSVKKQLQETNGDS